MRWLRRRSGQDWIRTSEGVSQLKIEYEGILDWRFDAGRHIMPVMEVNDSVRAAMAALSSELALYCAPALIFPRPEAGPLEIIASGTFTLVATPKQLFITAFHVWQRFKQAKQNYPDAVIAAYVGPPYGRIALTEAEFLDGDERTLDLAILNASRLGNIALDNKRFFQIQEWPIAKVSENDSVELIGFAGVDREVSPFVLELGRSCFRLGVSSVSDRQFVLGRTFDPRVFTLKNPKHDDQFVIGGMSGGPAFCRRDGILHLAGFIREGGSTDESILVSHATFLEQDGTLDHSRIPHLSWKPRNDESESASVQ